MAPNVLCQVDKAQKYQPHGLMEWFPTRMNDLHSHDQCVGTICRHAGDGRGWSGQCGPMARPGSDGGWWMHPTSESLGGMETDGSVINGPQKLHLRIGSKNGWWNPFHIAGIQIHVIFAAPNLSLLYTTIMFGQSLKFPFLVIIIAMFLYRGCVIRFFQGAVIIKRRILRMDVVGT